MAPSDTERRAWRGVVRAGLLLASGLVGAGLGTALVTVVWQSAERGRTLVEVLEVFVSWPAALFVLGLAFGLTFRDEIRRFLGEVVRVRYGPAILEREQARVSEEIDEEAEPEGAAAPPTEIKGEVLAQLFELLQRDRAAAEQKLREQLGQVANQATFWWLRFLDLFLVPHTKAVLRMLLVFPTTPDGFHNAWAHFIPARRERDAVLEALLAHQLIQLDPTTSLYRVTPAGQVFLEDQAQRGLSGMPPAGPGNDG